MANMTLNKTQQTLLDRLNGLHGYGSYKLSWTKDNNTLSLQNLNDGNQAHKLAEKYPESFKATQVSFRLVKLELLKGTI